METSTVGLFSRDSAVMTAMVDGLRPYARFRITSLLFELPASSVRTDFIVLDISDPGFRYEPARGAFGDQQSSAPEVKILSISDSLDSYRKLLDSGLTADFIGYITSTQIADKLGPALEAGSIGLSVFPSGVPLWREEKVLSGKQPEVSSRLTRREEEVLRGIAEGLPNKSIAADLGLSERTVKFHIQALFDKLGVHSRTEAAMEGARRGLITL